VRHIQRADEFIAANRLREPGMLLQDRRSGQLFLLQNEDDWGYVRLHRGAKGGVVPMLTEISLTAVKADGGELTMSPGSGSYRRLGFAVPVLD
jgi:hypothetical protein